MDLVRFPVRWVVGMAMTSALITGSLSSPSRSRRRYNMACTVVHLVFHHPLKHFLIWMRVDDNCCSRSIGVYWDPVMKRFFSKSPKKQPPMSAVSPRNDLVVHAPELPPKFVVPPVPHPRPHDHIALLPTQDGLLLRPHIAGQCESDHYVRITWGKIPEIEESPGAVQNSNVNWAVTIIVYGIVGIIELFTGSLSLSHLS